jgi:hypothetical protein
VSYSICVTCGRCVRDYDGPEWEDWDGAEFPPTDRPVGLPPHGCSSPVGGFIWNDGKHYWDEDRLKFLPWPPKPLDDADELPT